MATRHVSNVLSRALNTHEVARATPRSEGYAQLSATCTHAMSVRNSGQSLVSSELGLGGRDTHHAWIRSHVAYRETAFPCVL